MRLSWRANDAMAKNAIAARAVVLAAVRPFGTTTVKHQSYVRRLRAQGGLFG